jgi:hypothetical protein
MTIDGDKFSEAFVLLNNDELVWSEDFEAIRKPLRKLLIGLVSFGSSGAAMLPSQIEAVHKLIDDLTTALTKGN